MVSDTILLIVLCEEGVDCDSNLDDGNVSSEDEFTTARPRGIFREL